MESVGKGALAPGPLALCVVAAGLRNVDMCGAGSQVVWRVGRTVESVEKGARHARLGPQALSVAVAGLHGGGQGGGLRNPQAALCDQSHRPHPAHPPTPWRHTPRIRSGCAESAGAACTCPTGSTTYSYTHTPLRGSHTLHTCPTHLGVTLHAVGQAMLSQQALHGAQCQHAAAHTALAHKQHSRLAIGNRGTQGRDRKEVDPQNCESTK